MYFRRSPIAKQSDEVIQSIKFRVLYVAGCVCVYVCVCLSYLELSREPMHVAQKMRYQIVALLRAHCLGTIKIWGGAPRRGGAPQKFKMALIGLPIHVAHKMKHQFVALLRAHCMGTIKTWGGAPPRGAPPQKMKLL